MTEMMHEISPLAESDCFYVVERHKSNFTFPIHCHKVLELNFIENAEGVVRIVGDSIETITNYDLVLIGQENLEHAWVQGSCKSDSIREVTIQFSSDIFSDSLLMRNQFNSIHKMLERSKKGLSFSLKSIMKVYPAIDNIVKKNGFVQFIEVINMLYVLSLSTDSTELATSSFVNISKNADSRRVSKINKYIQANYKEDIRLNTLAELVGMTPPAFSRFFKLRTGSSLTEYITDIRMGVASKLLVDTTQSISEICYDCGFNNIANFNRIFKKRKNITPKTFREIYHKKKVII